MTEKNTVIKKQKTKKEPLFHITKRSGVTFKRAILVRTIAILAGFSTMLFLLYLISGENPITLSQSILSKFFLGQNILILFSDTAILLGIALALTPAFKMKFWNCGGEGQVLMGALSTAMTMFFLGDTLPLPLLIIVAMIISILVGSIWGLIPALFKAKWNSNETLFTLMMNYVAIQCVRYFIKIFGNTQGKFEPLPQFKIPNILGSSYALNIAVVMSICVIMYIYLRSSKQGYEISVVGESENTAKYVGISVPKVIIRTMIISGALCGLIGCLLVANGSCSIADDAAGGRGFTAILVSWLGKFNPFYMILTSFLVVFLQNSANFMSEFRIETSIGEIFVGMILLYIIGCEFFINYKINFRKKNKEVSK